MINKLTTIESKSFVPYKNLALEEYLLNNIEPNQCILYLWQNKNTIVIGHNQNAWKECLVSKLTEDGGYIARRLSGGGAVYHDLGNLNFTFVVGTENYNLEKQLNVIIKAMEKLGIKAEKSGRNDILIEGKKFSGNAFYEKNNKSYHHGTLMVNVNIEDLSKYLTVSKLKLKSKGVTSVKSRVTNISEHCENLTIDLLKTKLYEAFEEEYNLKSQPLILDNSMEKEWNDLTEKYSSWEYIYGKKLTFENEISEKFDWGEITFAFVINNGIITNTVVFSDAMDTEFIEIIKSGITNCKYSKDDLLNKLQNIKFTSEKETKMLNDIIAFLSNYEF